MDVVGDDIMRKIRMLWELMSMRCWEAGRKRKGARSFASASEKERGKKLPDLESASQECGTGHLDSFMNKTGSHTPEPQCDNRHMQSQA